MVTVTVIDRDAERRAREWNRVNPVGQIVRLYPIYKPRRFGTPTLTTTTSHARVSACGSVAVCEVAGRAKAVALDALEVVLDPDGRRAA